MSGLLFGRGAGAALRPVGPQSRSARKIEATPENANSGVVSSMRQEEAKVRPRAWILLVGVTAACGAFWAFDVWRLRAEWQRAKYDLARGKHAAALTRLTELARRWPADGEVLYGLGACELNLGHEERAATAWKRIPPSSPFAPRAAMVQARLALARHRLSVAEPLLREALKADVPLATEARETLVNIYKMQGRYDDARRLVRDGWTIYRDRVGTLQELARLDGPTPIRLEQVQSSLDAAMRIAPEDVGVGLGAANLAVRTGRLAEARRWLDRCVRRHPDDPVVWRARLDWAKAAQDEEEARQALAHLPGDSLTPNQLLALRAWFARRAGDTSGERRALEQLIAVDRGALSAMERLAELLLRGGQSAQAQRLRAQKADLARTLDWYTVKIFPADRLEHATELARAAEKLGRPFDARCWWELAADQPSHAALARKELDRLDREAMSASSPPPLLTPARVLAELNAPAPPERHGSAVEHCGATPRFVDDAESSGLRFTFDNGLETLHQMPETMSGGLGLLDYDGDGWLDVYAAQGGTFPPSPDAPNTGDRLFRNVGNGTFEDTTERSGIAALPGGYGHGVTVGDFDNDGHPDLFITRWRSYALLHNRGDGTFEDFTSKAGLGGDRDWPTSAAFADLDGDGDLDLYVCHYVAWDSVHPKTCWDKEQALYGFCGPPDSPSVPDHLFRNDNGRFVDVSAEAGIVDTTGEGLGVVAADLDGDGHVDLFVANDHSAKFLFLNRGNLRFEEVGHVAGVAASSAGAYTASMGVACGDVDGDGLPDLAVTNFYNEYTALYQNLGDGVFTDHSVDYGLELLSRHRLGFGMAFLDFNNDGCLDLVTANGHVDDHRPGVPQPMRAQLFAGTGDKRKFIDVTDRAGPPFRMPLIGRGLAAGDLDNDGRVDFVILSQNQPLTYFHNQTEGGHWLTLYLEGRASNRDAVGARVVVQANGRRFFGWRMGGGSYQSASDPRLHFGLGEIDRVESVEVTWPTGKTERFRNLGVDRGYLLRESDERVYPLAGFSAGTKARP
jgi:enediyne biosynthesis protein E4